MADVCICALFFVSFSPIIRQVSTEGEGHFLTDRGRCLDPTVVEEARAVVRQVLDNLDPDILDKVHTSKESCRFVRVP